MRGEDWFDATTFGSAYEQRTNTRGDWQHRPLGPRVEMRRGIAGDRMRRVADGDWRDGPAPDISG